MSSAVAGYKQTLGADAPPACYEDIDHARCLFIAGSNTAWAHPVLFRRIEAASARDPDTARSSSSIRAAPTPRPPPTCTCDPARHRRRAVPRHAAPACCGRTWSTATSSRRTPTASTRCRRSCANRRRARAAQICGITRRRHRHRGALVRATGPTLSLYCQGLNQSSPGTAKNATLINLHLATGQIGKPGAGPFSLTGQPNAMGGREVGGMANLLSAHRDLAEPEHRAEVAALWGVARRALEARARPRSSCSTRCAAGTVKMVWIACTNPAQSLPDQATVRAGARARRARRAAGGVRRHRDRARSPTCCCPRRPGARRTARSPTPSGASRACARRCAPPGEARADWAIAADFARRLEARLRPGLPTLFPVRDGGGCVRRARASPRAAATSTSRGCRTRCSIATGRSSGPVARRDARTAAAVRRRPLRDAERPRALRRRQLRRPSPSASMRAIRSASPPAACAISGTAMSRTGTVAALFGHAPRAGGRAESRRPRAARLRRRRPRARRIAPRQRRRARWPHREAGRPGRRILPMHWGSATLAGATARASTRSPPGLRARLEAARAQARRGAHREGRAAVAPRRVRLSRATPTARRAARRVARAARASSIMRASC